MAFLQWRRFNFFDKEQVKDPTTEQPFELLKEVNISACTSGRGHLIIADFEGNVYFINRQLSLTTFKAYEIRVSHIHQMKQHNLMVTVGEDEQGVNPIIKVWNLDKMDKGIPSCTRLTRAIPANKPTPVTCFTVHENLNFMAVGFENGAVLLFKGDVTRDRHSKPRVIHEASRPITGLAFKSSGKDVYLFVVTETSVLSINISNKDTRIQLEDFGARRGNVVMSDTTQDTQLVMGRQDAVYFYQPDGRGPCLAFEGEKLQLHWFRGYLIIVGKESKTMPRAPPMGSHSLEMNLVTVYDIHNKFIAYTAPYPEVIDIMCEAGAIYILSGDRKLYQLQEKDTSTKLEILFKKNNYLLAINLARSQQLDQDGLMDIFTQYGDHLYAKGDHDGAIQQYIRTIGKLEASYVIRKFLDAQKIHNLTKYLQSLHKSQLATEEHTTLLLNCYTKLKDVSKLDEFIMEKRRESELDVETPIKTGAKAGLLAAIDFRPRPADPHAVQQTTKTKDREVDFDVETAIKVCRQAGYHHHALSLAEKHQKHEWYLKIQLEDIRDYQEALTYIAKLSFEAAESNLKQYGKVLMAEAPQETTDLLKRLCTDYKPTNQPLVDQTSLEGAVPRIQHANAEEFIHIFVNNADQLTEFLEHMVEVQPNSSSLVYNTLLELYLHDMMHQQSISARVDMERKTLELLKNPDDLDDKKKCLKEDGGEGKKGKGGYVQGKCFKAGYGIEQALVLCQVNSFKAGILYLYEKAHLYQQILQYHMEHNEYVHVMETCKKFGQQDPQLWVHALSYFAQKEAQCKPQLMEVLSHIDKRNLMSPLLVIQTLAHNSTATLSVVKDYIIRRLQMEQDQMAEDKRLIRQYQEDTAKRRSQIQELQTSAKIFQASKCSICNHNLELPSVHFLCEPHSYHQHCIENYSESDMECPACASENRKFMDIIRAQEMTRDSHESFHNQLERAPDGFAVVADYFGRGLFNAPKLGK